jgi:zinc protease
LLFVAGSLLSLLPIASGQTKPGEARPWEHESSDIPVNARMHFGHFANGFRYVWLANQDPAGHCSLRLHVRVGSLAEEDDERGMAHFVEHMAFNGSKHHEAGTLVEWLTQQGMAFGSDVNAFTSFSDTIYKLELPGAEEARLREALAVLRDFADGALFEASEVEKEKPVIDAEERERDSTAGRAWWQVADILFEGTRYALRHPIGVKTVRDAFDAAKLRAFYRKWYRPENMTLIVVGDLGALNPAPLFEKAFADMPVPETPPAPEPPIGTPVIKKRFFTVRDATSQSVTIHLDMLTPWVDEPYTIATWTGELPLTAARSMVNTRFEGLAKKDGAPFTSARVDQVEAQRTVQGERLEVTCPAERWEEALLVCERELRRAIEQGFDALEFVPTARSIYSYYLVERNPIDTGRTSTYVDDLIRAASSRTVPYASVTRRDLMKPAYESLTVERCHEALAAAWSRGEPSLFLTGNVDLGADAEKILSAAYEKSRAQQLGEPTEEASKRVWAYSSTGHARGPIKKAIFSSPVKQLEGKSAILVEFENGVKVNFLDRQGPFAMIARLGEGRLSIEPSRHAVRHVAEEAFPKCGLVEHSFDQIEALLGSSLEFKVEDDHCELRRSGGGYQEACELLCAYLTAPGWREVGFEKSVAELQQKIEGISRSLDGTLGRALFPALMSDDPRFPGDPTEDDLAEVDLEAMRQWLEPQLEKAPLEVTVVGPLTSEYLAIASRTLGRLPPRRFLLTFVERREPVSMKTGLRIQVHIKTDIAKALVYIAFPTTDGLDPDVDRKLQFLGAILNDRLRGEVRERRGDAYAPRAVTYDSTTYPGYGMILIRAEADPAKVDQVIEDCLTVTDSLVAHGTTSEEVNRLREPMLTQLKKAYDRNDSWATALSQAQTKLGSLAEIERASDFYRNVQPADLDPLIKQYLPRERASIGTALPDKKP